MTRGKNFNPKRRKESPDKFGNESGGSDLDWATGKQGKAK
jgi:hypothetical protein